MGEGSSKKTARLSRTTERCIEQQPSGGAATTPAAQQLAMPPARPAVRLACRNCVPGAAVCTACSACSKARVAPPGGQLHEPVQFSVQLGALGAKGGIHRKVKQLTHGQRGHAGASEEVVHVLAVCGVGLGWVGVKWAGLGLEGCHDQGAGWSLSALRNRQQVHPAGTGVVHPFSECRRPARAASRQAGCRLRMLSAGVRGEAGGARRGASPSRKKSKARGWSSSTAWLTSMQYSSLLCTRMLYSVGAGARWGGGIESWWWWWLCVCLAAGLWGGGRGNRAKGRQGAVRGPTSCLLGKRTAMSGSAARQAWQGAVCRRKQAEQA